MGVLDGYDANRLQFVADALRTMTATTNVSGEQKNGHKTIRNADGSALTYAQIATAANLTSAQVQDLAGRV